MDSVAQIIQALAALLWPIFAFVVLFIFKSQIAFLITRVRKGKLLGQEFELKDELVELQSAAVATEKEVAALPPPSPPTTTAEEEDTSNDPIKKILEEATKSPIVALIMLGRELERQATHGLAVRGLLKGRTNVPLRQALSELHQYGFPPNLAGSLKLFDDVRTKIVHAKDGVADADDILRAIDLGITILDALKALPNEAMVVYQPAVDIFSDAACTLLIPDAKGIILEATSPGRVIKNLRIYPTTKTYFQKGKSVAWEWNLNRVWGKAWYKDPDTGEIKEAWHSAGEFIGRHLDDI